MSLHRIYGVILRNIFLFRHSIGRISDAFYWPTIDLLLWGLTSLYFKSLLPNASIFVLMIVSGILFWLIVWRGQYEISVGILEELWNKNLINLFATPLKFSELVISFIIIGIIKAITSLTFTMLAAYLLYQVQIFLYGFYLIPFMFLLIMTGWAVGFFVAGLILRFGSKLETFAWSLVAVFSPFSAVFYPVSILPGWAQTVASFIPTSYVFEGAREIIYKGHFDINKIYVSFGLNIFYLILSLIFFKKSFNKALQKGLVKVF